MKAATYAAALHRATEGRDGEVQDRLIANMLDLIRSRGHERLVPRIVHELARISGARSGARTVVVRVARASDRVHYGERIGDDIRALSAGAFQERLVVDPTAIGGYEVRSEGVALDRTYKRSLMALYRTLIIP